MTDITSLHVVGYAHDGIVSQVVVAVVHRLQHGRDAAFLFHVFLEGGGFVEDCTGHRMECFPQRLLGDFVFDAAPGTCGTTPRDAAGLGVVRYVAHVQQALTV